MDTKNGPTYPIIEDDSEFFWPEDKLAPPNHPMWEQYGAPGSGKCGICQMGFLQHVYDVLVEKPNKWALLCFGCFESCQLQLGPKKGQHYYRESKSKWRAVPPHWSIARDKSAVSSE